MQAASLEAAGSVRTALYGVTSEVQLELHDTASVSVAAASSESPCLVRADSHVTAQGQPVPEEECLAMALSRPFAEKVQH